jgi:O-antigen ligase
MFSVSPLPASALMIFALLTALFAWSPDLGLLMIIFSIPFERCGIIIPNSPITVTKILLLVSVISWLINILIFKKTSFNFSVFTKSTSLLILLYVVISLVSIGYAKDTEFFWIVMIKRMSVAVLYFFFLMNLANREKLFYKALNFFVLAGFFICIVGGYEFITGNPVLSSTVVSKAEMLADVKGASRVQGCAGHSNFHAAALAMMFPFVIFSLLTVKKPVFRLFLLMTAVLFIFNIFSTMARLGTIGLILGTGIFFFLSDLRFKFIKLAGVLLVISSVFVIISMMPGKFAAERYTGETGLKSIQYRLGWIIMSWEMIKDNPVLGVGTGNFLSQYQKYADTAPGMVPQSPTVQHNGIMQIWSENGPLGLVIFSALLFSVFFGLWKENSFRLKNKKFKLLRITVCSSFIVYIMCIGVIPALENEMGWLIISFAVISTTFMDKPESVTSVGQKNDQ